MREDIEDERSPLDLFPVIDERIIAYLQEHFPLHIPAPSGAEREDLYHAGQFSVIQHMIESREYQLDQARKRDAPTFSPEAAEEEEPGEE